MLFDYCIVFDIVRLLITYCSVWVKWFKLVNLMCTVTCAGRKLTAEDVDPAKEMFAELLYESSDFQSEGGETRASVGDFIRAEVHFFQWYNNNTELRWAASQDWWNISGVYYLLIINKNKEFVLSSGAGARTNSREVERYRCNHQISAAVCDQ